MKQYLLTIIAVLAAIILALFSLETEYSGSRYGYGFQGNIGSRYLASADADVPLVMKNVMTPMAGANNYSLLPKGTVPAERDETILPAVTRYTTEPAETLYTTEPRETLYTTEPTETRYTTSLQHTTMMTLLPSEIPPLDAGMVNVTDGAGYRVDADANNHSPLQAYEFQITIPYDPALLPQGFTEDDIQTYVYDYQRHRWMAIERDSVNEVDLLVYSRFSKHPVAETFHETSLQMPSMDVTGIMHQMCEGGGDSPLDFINAVLKTPEMPETSAYTPTSIKELKAADPLEGLTLMQPPTANNSGTANLSYPIEIPAGRQGMQPNLALTYSSGGGNGWLGVGWDIPIPSITVETRWGVPRYRTAWESEVYVYEGEQLVTKDGAGEFRKMAHRTNDTASIGRLSGNVRFYPRKDEVFDSIVRHGNGPSDYWWSVTHKNGVTDYYGKRHGYADVNYNSVLHDPYKFNIAQWMLTESVDPFGNWVRYYYSTEKHASVQAISLNEGIEVYLDSIVYTGHDSLSGQYTVRFNRNDNYRQDIITNERYGFREVTASTLCNVEVLYRGTILRRYYFVTENTRESTFKTRLKDLVRMDPPIWPLDCGNLFSERYWTNTSSTPRGMDYGGGLFNMVRYNFNYYDYPDQDSLYSTGKTISDLESDGIGSAFSSNNIPTTALGSTRGSGANFGGTFTIGAPDKNWAITDFNVGGNFNYGHSSTEGLLTLIDLNGDGLADKVYKRNYGIYYRPQVIDETDSLSFHFGEEVPISGIHDFLFEESHQPSLGVQGSIMAVVAANAGIPSTISTTSTYFTDVNGDGLPDLVTDRGALFNSLDSDGHPTFTPVNSYRTDPDGGNLDMGQMIVTSATAPCGGIIFDGVADSSIFCDYYYIKDSVYFKGFVDTCSYIHALLADPAVLPIGYDGFHFYFYHIAPESVQCGPILTEPDLDAVRVWVAPFDGNITIHSNIRMIPEHSEGYHQSRFADGVKYSVEHNGRCSVDNHMVLHAQDTSVLLSGSLERDDTLSLTETHTVEVDKYDILFFRIHSKEDRSYDNVEWNVEINYANVSGIDDYEKNKATYSSDSDYVLTGQYLFQAPRRGVVFLTGALTGNPGNNAGKLYISSNTVIDSITIVSNIHNDIDIDKNFELDSGQVVMLEIKGMGGNILWGNIECRPHLRFVVNPYDSAFSIPEELSCYPLVRLDIRYPDTSDTITALRKFFGPLYRGWGQFAYKNDSLSVNRPIETASLRLPAYLSDPNYTVDSATIASALSGIDTSNHVPDFTMETLSSMIDTIFNPLSDNTRWVEMNPDMEHYRWAGFSNTTAVSREGMSNTRPVREIAVLDGDDYPSDLTVTHELVEYDHPIPVSVDGYPVQTIRKMNVSVMGNGSLSVIGSEGEGHPALSFGQSLSGGANYVVSDYLDLNGDRYPDLLCKKHVQYTMPWGGIGPKQTLNPDHNELCNSNTESGGASFSGSYPVPRREAGGNAQKAKITIEGLGGSTMSGSDETSVMYLDINGDGLPDRVYECGDVALNRGYGFDAKENWNSWWPRKGSTVNTSGNTGVNFGLEQVSIGGGLGRNQSENVTESQLMDFNGDGLPDKVIKNSGSLLVSYNFGNGNWSPDDIIPGVSHISQSHSYSETGNGSLTLGFEPLFAKIQIGMQLSPYNSSFSHDNAQLTDINGDGYPDYVTSGSESSMTVYYNTAGKTNLLKTVTNFTGSTITLDYDMPLSCYEKPQRSWNLASVEVNDPASPLPAARSLTRFSYADPHYNRYERMDFGYGRVITSQFDTENNDSLYRYTVEEYENRSFTKRGRKLRDCVYDSAGNPYVEHRYFATVYDHDNSATVDTGCARSDLYVGHETELALYYEGNPAPSVVTRTDREYDRYRNIVEFSYYEDSTQYSNLFNATIEYAQGMPHNFVSLPVRIEVRNAAYELLQLRTASYTNAGKLGQLVLYSSPADSSVYNYTYDLFGNLDTCRLPKNANGQRVEYAYLYDSETHTYPVRVENVPLHFVSTAEYDYKFGKPVRTTDINGNEIRYTYDYLGRLLEILAPYEADNGLPYTIRMGYAPKNYDRLDIFTPDTLQSYACTFHYDPDHPGNNLRTVVLTDGLGRLLQTKKDAEIGGQEVSLVTGKVVYDCFGRSVAQYHPFTEDTVQYALYNDSVTIGTATETEYDIMDRQTYVKTPLNLVTTIEYGFDTCMGRPCFRTSVTDAMHNTIHTLTGTIGQQLKQIAPMGTVTRFEYDCLGRLLRSTDPDNISTFYTYDMLGRLTRRVHPDAGTDRYHYDAAGNMTSRVNALSDSIVYGYNYNQLTDVKFPRYPANNVHYQYGTIADAGINAVGKVVLQEDASGWQTFSYGKLGELTENIRTFALPFDDHSYTFKMQYQYDSYNRIQRMTYPDGEVVSYGYNRGGMLESVLGNKNGVSSDYIKEIRYNKYELKDSVSYGNGTGVRYMYDSLLRLSHLRSACADGVMQDIVYTYDSVSNITGIVNSAAMLPNGLGGAYSSSYEYDNLYRLTNAEGSWQGLYNLSYHTGMGYFANGRVRNKKHAARTLLNGHSDTVNYARDYYYENPVQRNTLTRVVCFGSTGDYDLHYSWTSTGNMDTCDTEGAGIRRLCWDEQNRLQGVIDENYLSYYLYDAAGDRTYKLTGKVELQNISGEWRDFFKLYNTTLYASPYVVATDKGYTKHYYAESERIASRIGGGRLHDLDQPIVENTIIDEKKEHINKQATDVLGNCLDARWYDVSTDISKLYIWRDSVQPEKECYWYHPDHLGSSSWITYSDGKAVQHLHYLPWGEDFVDQRLNSFDGVRFTFSAKEKDLETGLSYFGSRYYSSDLSIWLSVDPQAAKYPSLSPYVYCADNPVKLVDPNGEYLEVADNDDTHNDLLSIVGKTHRDRVIFNKDGSVSVNMEGLSQKAIDKDIGLSLINDMVNSDYKYYFETSDEAFICDESGARCTRLTACDLNKGVTNASRYGTDSNGGYRDLPMAGFDGQVVIAKSGRFTLYGKDVRKNIVFHELEENYLRTDKKMNYQGGVGIGAHRTAARIENNAWRDFAGQGDYTPPQKPQSKSKDSIMNYINYGIYK